MMRVLSWEQRCFNYAQRSARSSVEHFNQNAMRRHKVFNYNSSRHSIETICDMLYCTAYAEAAARNLKPPRAGFGAWPHNIAMVQIEQWTNIIDDLERSLGGNFEAAYIDEAQQAAE